jgi:hypothetical protein
VYEGSWKNGTYKPSRPVNLPTGANIYGFTFVDWQNNGQVHLMTFDEDGYLILYDHKGNFVWQSGKSYGRADMMFKEKTQSVANPEVAWSVRRKLAAVKTEKGQEVIVVKRIPLLPNVPRLGAINADVYSLKWDGSTMSENMVLGNVSGSVSDFVVDQGKLFLVAKGDVVSFVKNAATGELSKGSMLYYFNVGEK